MQPKCLARTHSKGLRGQTIMTRFVTISRRTLRGALSIMGTFPSRDVSSVGKMQDPVPSL